MSRKIDMKNRITGNTTAIGTLAALFLAAAPLAAQDKPAVATPPTLGPAPALQVPQVQQAQLPNGLKIQVVEMHALPIVQATLTINGGARLDGQHPGLASFTATMLTEGAGSRDGFELSAELDYLGANLVANTTWDATRVHIGAPKRTFARALDLFADVILRPTFKASDVARQRDLKLAALLQQRDQPTAVASVVFNRVVYPKGHPYHNPIGGDSSSIVRFDSTLVRDYWIRAADPRQATLIITGDITLDEARALAAEKFGDWRAPANPLTPTPESRIPAAPTPATRIILVDKPGAAQSVITIGAPGVDRTSPDYAAITVMNTILGGSFSSRLNDVLREQKGYTYGAGSSFSWRRLPGPFVASSSVRTNVTDSSLIIFFREFEAIRESDVPADELERAIAYVTLGALGDFATTRQTNYELTALTAFGLPLATIETELAAMKKITAADVRRVARKYIDPKHLTVVVVGDIATIRPGIEALGLGPISVYDADGNPVDTAATSSTSNR